MDNTSWYNTSQIYYHNKIQNGYSWPDSVTQFSPTLWLCHLASLQCWSASSWQDGKGMEDCVWEALGLAWGLALLLTFCFPDWVINGLPTTGEAETFLWSPAQKSRKWIWWVVGLLSPTHRTVLPMEIQDFDPSFSLVPKAPNLSLTPIFCVWLRLGACVLVCFVLCSHVCFCATLHKGSPPSASMLNLTCPPSFMHIWLNLLVQSDPLLHWLVGCPPTNGHTWVCPP